MIFLLISKIKSIKEIDKLIYRLIHILIKNLETNVF